MGISHIYRTPCLHILDIIKELLNTFLKAGSKLLTKVCLGNSNIFVISLCLCIGNAELTVLCKVYFVCALYWEDAGILTFTQLHC